MDEFEPRNFLRPCLLLLLREQPAHGYELAARLKPMRDSDGDTGGTYRALRGLERDGLLHSGWDTCPGGPPRRTYSLTPHGLAWLDAQAHRLEQLHEVLHVFLDRHTRLVTADLPPRTETMTGARCSVTEHRSGPTR